MERSNPTNDGTLTPLAYGLSRRTQLLGNELVCVSGSAKRMILTRSARCRSVRQRRASDCRASRSSTVIVN